MPSFSAATWLHLSLERCQRGFVMNPVVFARGVIGQSYMLLENICVSVPLNSVYF